MKIVQEVNRNKMMTMFQHTRDFNFIGEAISSHIYCYQVSLDASDLNNLITNSSPKIPAASPGTHRHPSIGEVVKEINDMPDFLNITHPVDFRGLNGVKVKEKIEEYEKGLPLKDCFVMDAWPSMFREQPYYVIDGMHSLVAYALWSNMNPEKFPINVWCCTNKTQIYG